MGAEDFVLSGAGLWPLLALLAAGADDLAGAELAAALDRPTDNAQRDALEIIDILRGGQSTTAALGLWAREGVPLDSGWAAPLPEEVVGALTEQAALDRWAAEQTGGLIDTFPLEITEETVLVLASALTAKVRWRIPFEGYPRGRGDTGRPDDPGPADQPSLPRTTSICPSRRSSMMSSPASSSKATVTSMFTCCSAPSSRPARSSVLACVNSRARPRSAWPLIPETAVAPVWLWSG